MLILIPLAFKLVVQSVKKVLPLVRIAAVQAALSGQFLLEEVPKLDEEEDAD